jgi:hypothetical protein
MRRTLLIAAALTIALFGLQAGTAQATVCADHPDQAAAQLAKDTFDGDGDGLFDSCSTRRAVP